MQVASSSEDYRELVEGGAEPMVVGDVSSDLVVAAADVLDERVASPRGGVATSSLPLWRVLTDDAYSHPGFDGWVAPQNSQKSVVGVTSPQESHGRSDTPWHVPAR